MANDIETIIVLSDNPEVVKALKSFKDIDIVIPDKFFEDLEKIRDSGNIEKIPFLFKKDIGPAKKDKQNYRPIKKKKYKKKKI